MPDALTQESSRDPHVVSEARARQALERQGLRVETLADGTVRIAGTGWTTHVQSARRFLEAAR